MGLRTGGMHTRDQNQFEFDEDESANNGNGNSPGWRTSSSRDMRVAGSSSSGRPQGLSNDSYSESEYDSNSSSSSYAAQGTHSAPTEHNVAPAEEPCDLWVCLVCGFIGCGSSHCNHIRDHYVRHLHAYAMNTGASKSLEV